MRKIWLTFAASCLFGGTALLAQDRDNMDRDRQDTERDTRTRDEQTNPIKKSTNDPASTTQQQSTGDMSIQPRSDDMVGPQGSPVDRTQEVPERDTVRYRDERGQGTTDTDRRRRSERDRNDTDAGNRGTVERQSRQDTTIRRDN
jgi:hypothetical protein